MEIRAFGYVGPNSSLLVLVIEFGSACLDFTADDPAASALVLAFPRFPSFAPFAVSEFSIRKSPASEVGAER